MNDKEFIDKRLEEIRKQTSYPIPDEFDDIERDTAEAILEGTKFLLSEIDRLKESIRLRNKLNTALVSENDALEAKTERHEKALKELRTLADSADSYHTANDALEEKDV